MFSRSVIDQINNSLHELIDRKRRLPMLRAKYLASNGALQHGVEVADPLEAH